MGKRKRKRVSKETVRKNAKKGGGSNWYNLPPGVNDWAPDKKGTYKIDVLPYEVTDDNHPDGISPGYMWFKRIFVIHKGVGPNNSWCVCPKSIGKRCPIHEERDKIMKSIPEDKRKKKHKDLIQSLKGQVWIALNIKDQEDSKKVAVFLTSQGKFWNQDQGTSGLKKELEEGDEDQLHFFDTEDGRTLRVRFSEASYSGSTYLKATKFDFKKRKDMDEDEVMAKVVNLDDFLIVLSYDKLKKLFLQEDDDEDEEKKDKKPKKSKGKKKKKEPEPDDDDDVEDHSFTCPVCDEGYDEEARAKDCCPKPKKNKKNKEKTLKKRKPKKGKKKCPEGGTFGEDADKFDACDDCPLWKACDDASG